MVSMKGLLEVVAQCKPFSSIDDILDIDSITGYFLRFEVLHIAERLSMVGQSVWLH